jgi:SagB-type dehydrogenase family enzyme
MMLFAGQAQPSLTAPHALAGLKTAPLAAGYHLNAKFSRYEPAKDPDWLTAPHSSPNQYQDAFEGLPRIPLDPGAPPPSMSLAEAIQRRRSVRQFATTAITASQLATILRFGGGVVSPRNPGRAVPSGGAKYPVQMIPCVGNVQGVSRGLYGYDVKAASLVPLRTGTQAWRAVQSCCLYPDNVENAAVVILLVAILPRSTGKYGERGYRLAVQEAGHVAQNLLLVSTALGLGSIVLAGFDEHDIEQLIGIDGETETMLSSVLVGQHAGQEG